MVYLFLGVAIVSAAALTLGVACSSLAGLLYVVDRLRKQIPQPFSSA